MDTYFTPRLADRRRIAGTDGVILMVRRMFLVTAPLVAAVLVVAVAFTDPLLQWLYGPTYLEYAGGMRLMAIFYALLYSFWPLQSALKALEKPRPIFIASMAALVAMATIGIWAIVRWGVYGTIGGQALSAGIISVVLWSTWRRWVGSARQADPAPADSALR
jgi:O-antigen/teichoic acid export membrane protein